MCYGQFSHTQSSYFQSESLKSRFITWLRGKGGLEDFTAKGGTPRNIDVPCPLLHPTHPVPYCLAESEQAMACTPLRQPRTCRGWWSMAGTLVIFSLVQLSKAPNHMQNMGRGRIERDNSQCCFSSFPATTSIDSKT